MYIVGEMKVLKKQKKILQVGNDRCKKKKDLKSLLCAFISFIMFGQHK